MDKLKPNPFLEFKTNQLEEVRKLFDYGDVNKLKQDLDTLENWIKKQNHFTVREFDEGYLERYLIANKGSVERAKKRLDKLLTLRNLLPELTCNFDIRNEFLNLLKVSHQIILPKLTADNYRIAISKVLDQDYEKVELINFYRYMLVSIEYLLHHDYNAGFVFVMDAREMNMGLLHKLNPLVVHKALTVMEAYGMRLKCIHFVSKSKFLETMVGIFKQGMSEKLRNRIQMHTTIDSLCKFIPKEILPKDYGGDEKSIHELSENHFNQLSSDDHIAKVKRSETTTVDESCRLSSTFNQEYSGVPGSFKTLSVD